MMTTRATLALVLWSAGAGASAPDAIPIGRYAFVRTVCGSFRVGVGSRFTENILNIGADGEVSLESTDARGCRVVRWGHVATRAHVATFDFTHACGSCEPPRPTATLTEGFGSIGERLDLYRRGNTYGADICPLNLNLRRSYRRTSGTPRSTAEARWWGCLKAEGVPVDPFFEQPL